MMEDIGKKVCKNEFFAKCLKYGQMSIVYNFVVRV